MRITKTVPYENCEALKKIARLQDIISTLKGKKLLLYGAGVTARYLFRCCIFDGIDIRICDSSKKGRIAGIPEPVYVVSPEILNWADYIMPTVFYKRDELIASILGRGVPRQKIVEIYSAEDRLPIYEFEVDLDPENCDDICTVDEYGKRNKLKEWSVPDNVAFYDQEMDHVFFDAVTKDYYLRYIHPGDTVLDFGAGTGRLSAALSESVKDLKITAADINPGMLNMIKKRYPEFKRVLLTEKVLPFPDSSFDCVVSLDVMIHLDDWRDYLKEQVRVLKPEGFMIHCMLNDDHIKAFSKKEYVRKSYISGEYKNYMTAVSADELRDFCSACGNVSIVERIPYNFMAKTGFSMNILTRSESYDLASSYIKLMKNPVAADVISRFEHSIVSLLPADYATYNIVVFKKHDNSVR